MSDCGSDLGGGERALELVGSGDHTADGHDGDHTGGSAAPFRVIVDRMSRESHG
jgi:hypothetical protein